jgi:hypothetical protein
LAEKNCKESGRFYGNIGVMKGRKSTNILPYSQVQASKFSLQISYFLQKCKKGKPGEMDLPLLKYDITTSESTFKMLDT